MMTSKGSMLAFVCAMLGVGVAKAGPFDLPDARVYVRAEDQQRARLMRKPCTKADIGHGCSLLADGAVREIPCTYHINAQTIGSLPTDQCVKMEKPRRFRGIWIDEFEGQKFIPEGTKAPEWPRTDRRSPGWREQFNRAHAAAIWLDVDRVKLRHDFANARRRMWIDFIGRKTMYPGSYGHMGMSGNEIIVDRVISIKRIE